MPSAATVTAAVVPAKPPPTTITSYSSSQEDAALILLRNTLEARIYQRRAIIACVVLSLAGAIALVAQIVSSDNTVKALCAIFAIAMQATLLPTVLFDWTRRTLLLAFERGLPTAATVILFALLIARAVASPLFAPSQFVEGLRMFCLPASAVLLLICWTPEDSFVRDSNLTASATLRKYAPAILIYFLLETLGRVFQMLFSSGSIDQMLGVSNLREIVVLSVLASAAIATIIHFKHPSSIGKKECFCLLLGVAFGLAVGELLGIFTGSSVTVVFIDFIETTRALLRAAFFIALFLLAYESSLSVVTVFGLFLVAPVCLSRLAFLNVPSIPIADPNMLALLQEGLTGIIAFCFIAASTMLASSFIHSNSFRTLFDTENSSAISESSDTRFNEALKAAAVQFALTAREQDILEYLAQGYSAKRIGEKLFISPYTVQNHTKCIYRKMGVRSKQELIERINSPEKRQETLQ
ncbi:LuxR family transcriptional regulator [Adlercreutzia sp. R25]|uniref:LuxR family transcriptional regulator n=1 Tax=Adlercreutzia shanghongiae TaxID=3111773 RepID=A0ABU6J1B5_9ACTN|nr:MULTISPECIES: LuxR family transcriptional regulator [unclassified Adlercreutzia]MEC4273781.1 LuxR family transcriptional regulator [Adlercreutzia sp. R25]MEC4295859.1 LuxR family transcriptional regulator [Adlercreutzia sp. R22]